MERTTKDKEDRYYRILLAVQNGCNTASDLHERFASFKAKTFVQKMYKEGFLERFGTSKEIYYKVNAKGYELIQTINERKQNEKRRMLEDCDGDC